MEKVTNANGYSMKEIDLAAIGHMELDFVTTPNSLIATKPAILCLITTSTCRNFDTISSGFGRLFDIFNLLFSIHNIVPIYTCRMVQTLKLAQVRSYQKQCRSARVSVINRHRKMITKL